MTIHYDPRAMEAKAQRAAADTPKPQLVRSPRRLTDLQLFALTFVITAALAALI